MLSIFYRILFMSTSVFGSSNCLTGKAIRCLLNGIWISLLFRRHLYMGPKLKYTILWQKLLETSRGKHAHCSVPGLIARNYLYYYFFWSAWCSVKIRTICNAWELWNLVRSSKPLCLLYPPDPGNLPGTTLLTGKFLISIFIFVIEDV